MLAEKFFLFLETLISDASDDQSAITISMAPHIPIKLPVSEALAVTRPRGRRAWVSSRNRALMIAGGSHNTVIPALSGRALMSQLARALSIRVMKISDVTCLKCGSSYLMAESISVNASPGREDCAICGSTLAIWSDGRRRTFRLMLQPEHKYLPVPARRFSKKSRLAP
jgi:hypothetical protein